MSSDIGAFSSVVAPPENVSQVLSSEARDFVLKQTRATTIESTERIQSLWSGYGEIVRCHLRGNAGTSGADASSSVVLKHVQWPTSAKHPRGWNSDLGHKRKVRSYEVEVAWYENYSQFCGPLARVPQCLGTRHLDSGVLLLLEDLNTQGYPARSSVCSSAEIDSCLRWLANLHATFVGVSPDSLWPIGCYWHLATRPEEWAALPEGPLKAAAAEVDRRLNDCRFQTLVHGDAKLANFCFSDDGAAVAAVDFQYVGGGCGMKDLAYFMSSCLDETQCQAREEELLEQYFAELRSALVRCDSPVDASELEGEWRELYPLAWTDFYRFLQGWSPGHWKIHSYSESVAAKVIAAL